MKRKFTLFMLGILVCLSSSYAEKWRVNNNNGADADFTTFQEAVDAASAMDTLYFDGSTIPYGEEVTLNKPLVIIGPGYFLTDNENTQANQQAAYILELNISSSAQGSIIIGMTIGDPDNYNSNQNLILNADDLYVYRCHILGDLYLAQTQNVKNIAISSCFIEKSIEEKTSDYTTTSTIINNNIILDRIFFSFGSTLVIDGNTVNHDIDVEDSEIINNIQYGNYANDGIWNNGNIVKNNILVGDECPNDAGAENNQTEVDENTLFVNYPNPPEGASRDARFQLPETSPAKAAGIAGIDCGAFGGNSPYVLSGLPPAPHIYEATIPSTGDNINGLTVTVHIEVQE